MATKSEQKALAVVDYLMGAGWVEDGQTDAQTVRVGTSKSPVYGGIGGELRTFGGRARFVKVGTETGLAWKVTVGPRSVNFYRRGDVTREWKDWQGVVRTKTEQDNLDFRGFDTGDLDGIRQHAETLR